MTIEQIHEEQQKKLSAMFEEFGVFFAFSKQQFAQSRKAVSNMSADLPA